MYDVIQKIFLLNTILNESSTIFFCMNRCVVFYRCAENKYPRDLYFFLYFCYDFFLFEYKKIIFFWIIVILYVNSKGSKKKDIFCVQYK